MTPEPIYLKGTHSGIDSQRDLGHGHTIVDLTESGKVVGVEFIPTPPLPLVKASETIDGEWYWWRTILGSGREAVWSIVQINDSPTCGFRNDEMTSDLEMRGPIPQPQVR